MTVKGSICEGVGCLCETCSANNEECTYYEYDEEDTCPVEFCEFHDLLK